MITYQLTDVWIPLLLLLYSHDGSIELKQENQFINFSVNLTPVHYQKSLLVPPKHLHGKHWTVSTIYKQLGDETRLPTCDHVTMWDTVRKKKKISLRTLTWKLQRSLVWTQFHHIKNETNCGDGAESHPQRSGLSFTHRRSDSAGRGCTDKQGETWSELLRLIEASRYKDLLLL